MKLSVNKLGALFFYIMNNKLKIKIKIDITGPINWTKETIIDYNNNYTSSKCFIEDNNPFMFCLRQIEGAVSNIEYMLNYMTGYNFKIIE